MEKYGLLHLLITVKSILFSLLHSLYLLNFTQPIRIRSWWICRKTRFEASQALFWYKKLINYTDLARAKSEALVNILTRNTLS